MRKPGIQLFQACGFRFYGNIGRLTMPSVTAYCAQRSRLRWNFHVAAISNA